MIMDLYSSGSLSAVTLDFGLGSSASTGDILRHDVLDIVSGGDSHVPLTELLHGEDGTGSALGFAGEQRIPDDMHIPVGGQSVLGGFEVPLGIASDDLFSSLGRFELGSDGLMTPISEHHLIA